MSRDALNRHEVVKDFVEGRLTRLEAAGALGKSERQVSRMVQKFRKKGILGLEHALVGRVAPNKTPPDVFDRVVKLLKGSYAGFNCKHAHERIVEVEKLRRPLGYSTLKRLARREGLVVARARHAPKARTRRTRFAQTGFMLQMDGSHHVWWREPDGTRTPRCLIAGIDDATSDVPYGEFFPTESLEGYLAVIRQVIALRGVPRVIYVDRASFLGGLPDTERSQFHRMCEEMGTRVIHAQSPQAKGRIERLWGTLQDRLVSEFRLHGVSDANSANAYLNQTFLPETWLRKFTVAAESSVSLYRPKLPKAELDQIFCLKLTRKVRNDHTILFENEIYGVTTDLGHSIARKYAEIRIYPDGSLRGFYGGRDLELRQERKAGWARAQEPKTQPGLPLWKRVLGSDFSIHSVS